MKFKAQTTLDKFFEVGIIIKGADGLVEVLGGLLLLFIKPETINHWAVILTQPELTEDPGDYIATHVLHLAQSINHGALVFGALYLLSHGITKVVLVIEILRNRLWAYPALIILTLGFMAYQLYELTQDYSLGLVLFTIYDGLVVWLTAKEYSGRRLAKS